MSLHQIIKFELSSIIPQKWGWVKQNTDSLNYGADGPEFAQEERLLTLPPPSDYTYSEDSDSDSTEDSGIQK
jgi:hypothetical protein